MLKGRLEDDRMLTGRGRYVSDWNLPDQAYAHFLRSDRAHAEIVSIDKEAALGHPGVVAVFTGADLADALKSLPAALPAKGRGGSELINPGRPALAKGRVRFTGDAVALVVAESAVAAQDAAELIAIEYRDLPAVVSTGDALAAGAPLVHDSVPGNIVLDFESGDEAGARKAFENAARVIDLTVDISRVVGNPMEPRACLAAFVSDQYHLYTCTQGVAIMRNQLSAVLGVPPEKIRVIAEEVGGGFGVRFNLYPEYCAALFAAKRLGRPVKWTGTRSEVFLADEQARDVRSRGELALDGQGRILGMRFDMVANLGAYLAPTGPFINTIGIVNCLSGVYDVPATYARIRLALTNTAPMAAYRGAGRPIMSYALERLMDHAARELGQDPTEFRRRNLIPKDKFPYKIAAGFEYDCGDFAGVMDKALSSSGWADFPKRREEAKKRGKLRGRGIATYIEATGAGFAPHDQVELRWGKDGHVTVYAPTHNHGQGHETTYAQLLSGVLGMPLESFRLRTAGPEFYIAGNATGGSRSLLAVGSVVMLAGQEMVKKGMALAAEALEAAVADIEFVEGNYRIKGTDRSISLPDLAKKFSAEKSLDIQYQNKFGATFPNGCHIAEVEIEPETGDAEIVSYVACDDAGNIINHQIVEGQVQGGLTQGAGQVFNELAVYDRSGQLLTGSFMDYAMPRAGLVNGIKLLDHPVPTKLNPLGAKGVGEAGVTGSMPALMNAVVDALRQAGVRNFEMPATSARIWKAIQEARK
ncbi:MAG TPA: xanthine dehydrogenase family protein molybdopterin-binding subunit [Burkholderiales bacterium]|nr:xanthine dehydrogenase family protein molybdopterin-binding subunit [Burkholderiales bacterium]